MMRSNFEKHCFAKPNNSFEKYSIREDRKTHSQLSPAHSRVFLICCSPVPTSTASASASFWVDQLGAFDLPQVLEKLVLDKNEDYASYDQAGKRNLVQLYP